MSIKTNRRPELVQDEEREIAAAFGEALERYRRAVPAFIPRSRSTGRMGLASSRDTEMAFGFQGKVTRREARQISDVEAPAGARP
jgi:hypothetical protein